MTVAREYLTAGLAVARRDAMVLASYRTAFVSQILQAIFTLTLFYYMSRLLSLNAFGSADEYYAFLVVGLVVLRIMIATVGQLPRTIRQELVAGTFERLIVSPLGAVGGILGMTLFPLLTALLVGVVMIAFTAIAFGLSLAGTAPLALPAAALAGLAMTPLAVLLGAAVLAFKQATGGAMAVTALLTLVAGFYFPVSILPAWIEWASEVQPLTPSLDLMRHLLIGLPLSEPAWVEVGKLIGFTLVLSAVSLVVLRAAVEWGQRRGTITEY